MAKNQIKRLVAPKTWPVERKVRTWIAKPLPGPHTLERCIALSVVLRDMLKLASTSREAKKILGKGEIIINGKLEKEPKTGVGLFDVVSIAALKKNYRVLMSTRGRLTVVEIPEERAKLLPLKVTGKTIVKGGRQQINFSNGWNLLTKEKYTLGDTVLFDTSERSGKSAGTKPVKQIQLKKGCAVAIVEGKHVGRVGTLEDVKEEGALKKKKVAVLKAGKDELKTDIHNLFVVGDKSPEFTAFAE